tara:strand:+ start:1472 stop:1858 length:387 start_codon:yes stop_codon:yes gene_type:complete
VVIVATPSVDADGLPLLDGDGEPVRSYDHLKWYSPQRSIFGFDWYPWPAQRANPRPVKDRTEVPLELGLLATPVESARCSGYIDMAIGAAACPEYPRLRWKSRPTPHMALLSGQGPLLQWPCRLLQLH